MEITQHGSGDVAQPTCDPMAFHGRSHLLGDDQPDARAPVVAIAPPPNVNDDIGLHRARPTLQRGVKLR
jgi:hypothetical protein